jgi:HSP20 family protein
MFISDVFTSRGGRDLFADLERLIEAVDRGHAAVASSSASSNLDIWANDDALQVSLDAPGIDPASIDLTVLGDSLTIRGQALPSDGEREWLRRERAPATFARTVRLPYPVDAEHAEARYTDGVITATLHRQAGSKPQRISVQAA